jgi:uncharacterized phiE125 gp8 family phage protein
MTSPVKVIAGPAMEPVSVQECINQSRLDDLTQAPNLPLYIQAAREYVEDAAGYTINEQTLEVALDQWPRAGYIDLPRATPLVEIVSVTVTDDDSVSSVWPSGSYWADTHSMPGRLVLVDGGSWPSTTLRRANGITIRYKAGDSGEPSGAVKLPILLLVAGMVENRESETVTDRASVQAMSMQYGVDAFISRIRNKLYSVSY